jgi:hypothetical protein
VWVLLKFYGGYVQDVLSMMLLECEMGRSIWTYNFAVVSENIIVQNSALGDYQTRVPQVMLIVVITRKYKVLIVLGECREILSKNWSAGWCVRVSILVGIFTAVTSSAARCGKFALP